MDYKHIRLAHTGTMITTRCNLKCKLCCVGAPTIYEKRGEIPYDRLLRTYETYFQLIEHVEKFSLGGGEPLLRKELPLLIDFFMEHQTKIGVLEVITNGTLMPSNDLIATLKKYKDKVTVLVDKYGDWSPLAEQVGGILKNEGIPNQVRQYYGKDCHCGGWVDLGDFTLKHHTKEEQKALFEKCAYYTKTTKIGVCGCDGLLYTCGRCYISMLMGVIDVEDECFVDILNPNKSIDELRKDFVRLLEIECPPACAYCNGMCQDSKRYLPAEQME